MHLIATCLRDRLPLRVVSARARRRGWIRRRSRSAIYRRPAVDSVCPGPAQEPAPQARDRTCSRRRVGVWAVFSDEPPISRRRVLAYDDGAFRCVCPVADNGGQRLRAHKHRVEGLVAFVPSVVRGFAASLAVRLLCGLPLPGRWSPMRPIHAGPARLSTTAG